MYNINAYYNTVNTSHSSLMHDNVVDTTFKPLIKICPSNFSIVPTITYLSGIFS